MRKKKGDAKKKLIVSRETLAVLDPMSLQQLAAAAAYVPGGKQQFPWPGGGCGESAIVCSVMHTCVSCKDEEATIIALPA